MSSNAEQRPTNDDIVYTYAVLLGALFGWRYRSISVGVMTAVVCAIAIYGHRAGYWQQVATAALPHLKAWATAVLAWFHREQAEETAVAPYEVCVGQDIETKQFVITNLQELGSFGVFAITGGGKTSFIHSLIHQLISSSTPKDLGLVIADLKEGLDFRIYKRLPHLLYPVASTTAETEQQIMGLLEEMSRRANLFKAIPEDLLCNSLDDYHQLGGSLGLPRLPRILAIVDEFQNVTLESEAALNGMVKLAKEGRAFGISMVCCTQLPNVDALPTALKSQFSSVFCGYLKNPSHYYKIVETTKEYWQPFHEKGKITGRFMADIAGEMITVQSVWIPKKELEHLAREWSRDRTHPEWPDKYQSSETPVHTWSGSSAQKRAMLIQWLNGFDEMPTFENFQSVFHASERTYYHWVPALWKELH